MSEITISKKRLLILSCIAISLLFFLIGSFEQQVGFYIIGFLLMFTAIGVTFKNDRCMEYLRSKLDSDTPSNSETTNLNQVLVDSERVNNSEGNTQS